MSYRQKSFAAFKFSMESLTVDEAYMWTLTWPTVVDIIVVRKAWNHFLNGGSGLLRAFPPVSGIRVFEMHPGKDGEHSHGLHIHFVVDKFLPVDVVRSIARKAGFGRDHVKRIEEKKHALYLSKYLRKQDRSEALKGCRLWAAFGVKKGTRVSHIEAQSKHADAWRYAKSMIRGWSEMGFGDKVIFVESLLGEATLEECFERIGWKAGGPELHKFLGKVDAIMDTKEKLAKQRLKWTRQGDGVPLSGQEKADRIRKSAAKALADVGIMKKDKKSETGYSYRNKDVKPF